MPKITIGNIDKDKELVEAIIQYKNENNLDSGAAIVRLLCQYALEVKKVGKRRESGV